MDSIRHTLRYLTSKHYRNELQAKQEAADYFSRLPLCRGTILIADPTFGDGEYQCSVTIPAHALLDWTKNQAERTIMRWPDEMSWPFFQQWLSEAEPANARVNPLPKRYFQSIQPEMAEWVMNGKAQVWCRSCDGAVADITSAEIDNDNAGNSYYWWTSVWHCPAGHELYRAKKEMRISRVSHRFKITD